MTYDFKKKFSFLLSALGLFFLASVVNAQSSCDSTCDSGNKDCLERLQELCQTKVTELRNQANTLSNQIAQFNAQIRLTSLKISQTEAQIALLGGRITQLGDSLDSLTTAFSARAVETYKLAKFENNFIFVLTATDINEAVSRIHYLEKIQEEDRSLMDKLKTAKTAYIDEKQSQEDLQKQLKTQQANLNAQKTAKNNLLQVTKNNETKYQSLLAATNAQLSKFRSFAANKGGSSILSGQTKCNEGWSGCYYNQRDSEWGNMYLGGTNYLMKDSGCFVTSVAMLASHSGKNIKPGDIASLPAIFTSQGELTWAPFNVNGTSVSIRSDTKSSLDGYLSSGHPVIAKLSYSYGDHFIVILRKEGDNYIMNDPYMENGFNKKIEDGGYKASDIVSLRLVSF